MSDDDIDKAVKEAAEFEAQDKKRKEAIDTRNEADAMVFQTEKSNINIKLLHVGRNLAGLQIMNSQKIIAETNSVCCSKTVLRVVENLLGMHFVANGIINIHVQRFLRLRQFLPKPNTPGRKIVKFGASNGR